MAPKNSEPLRATPILSGATPITLSPFRVLPGFVPVAARFIPGSPGLAPVFDHCCSKHEALMKSESSILSGPKRLSDVLFLGPIDGFSSMMVGGEGSVWIILGGSFGKVIVLLVHSLFLGEKFSNLCNEKISACRICTFRGFFCFLR